MSKKFLGFFSVLFFFFFFLSPLLSRLYSATVQGKAVKSDGLTALPNAEIMLRTSNWSSGSLWTTSASDGMFSFSNLSTSVNYVLEMRAPWSNTDGLIAPDLSSTTITFTDSSQTYYRDGTVGTNFDSSSRAVIAFTIPNNTVTGILTKSNSAVISGAYINAYKEMGMGWVQTTTNASGEYTLKVGSAAWMVSPSANYGGSTESVDWTYNKMPTRVKFANNDSPGTSTTVNFTAQLANCAVTGTVLAPDGSALTDPQSNVNVS